MLKKIQLDDFGSSHIKLIKACRTRWLSHKAAVVSMKAELSSVHSTLGHYASKQDCTAIGVLKLISKKSFFFLCIFWIWLLIG